jgi:hypothetical protein
MAAFDFPSPPVEDGFEVKNELTGITYKYDAASGSWVVVASNVQDNYYTKPEVDDLLQSVSPDLIWENTNPPLPDTPYKLWYNTDTLELYFYYCDTNGVCAWTPTSVPLTALEVITTELDITNAMVASVERLASANFSELQQVQADLGQVTLQEVLDNGNTATKGATFGEPVSVGWDAFTPQPSHAIPLSVYEDGQGDQDQLISDNTDAIKENADDLEDIANRVQEIEKIRTTGKWKATDGVMSTPQNGQFNLTTGAGSNSLTRDWPSAKVLIIAAEDMNGVYHRLDGWKEGDRIEIIGDTETQSWASYTIGPAVPGARDTMIPLASCEIWNNIPINRFDYRIRRYVGATIDIDDSDERYVNVTGDTMEGTLKVRKAGDPTAAKVKTLYLDSGEQSILHLQYNGNDRLNISSTEVTSRKKIVAPNITLNEANFVTIKNSRDEELWYIKSEDSENMSSLVIKDNKQWKIGTAASQMFKVYNDNSCRLSNLRDPGNPQDAVNKRWFEERVAPGVPSSFLYKYVGQNVDAKNLRAGEISRNSSEIYAYVEDERGWHLMSDPGKKDYWAGSYWVRLYHVNSNSKVPNLQMHFKQVEFHKIL